MASESPLEESTRDVAERWFAALTGRDMATALSCLLPDVEWINYTPVAGYNDVMPWIGTYHGPDAVIASFQTFIGVCDPQYEQVVKLAVDGEEAAGVIAERGVVRVTGIPYAIEFIQWLTIRDGKIVRWKSYTDPSSIQRAIRGEGAPSLGGPDERTPATQARIAAWLDAMQRGDGEAVMAGLADDVVFVTPREQDDLIIPYVGTRVGKARVAAAFAERARIVETVGADVGEVTVQGSRAWVSITTRERYLPTGREFTIEAAHSFELDADGRIRRWRAFFDPNPEVDVLRGASDGTVARQVSAA